MLKFLLTDPSLVVVDDDDKLYEDLPASIWNSLPPNANYVKECIKLSGYDNVESIVKLGDEKEQNKMFQFVVDMKDAVPDPKATFGIFEKKPESIKLLPGLEPIFKKFIDKVKNFANRKSGSSTVSLSVEKKSKPTLKAKKIVEKKLTSVVVPTVKDIEKQMTKYMVKIDITKPFKVTPTENPLTFSFLCEYCRWIGMVTVNREGKALLSNVQRHFKSQCEKKFSKKGNSSKSATLTDFYKFKSARFEEGMDRDGIHFHNHSATSQNSNVQEATENPKNSNPPAGIHDTIENSGR